MLKNLVAFQFVCIQFSPLPTNDAAIKVNNSSSEKFLWNDKGMDACRCHPSC